MEITTIFANKLASFKFDDTFNSEYDKKLDNWKDFDYIYDKALNNNIDENLIDQFFDEIYLDREFIRGEIKRGCDKNCLFELFTSLHNKSIHFIKFEESKGKFFVHLNNKNKKRLSRLRLYALRINNNLFIITGGAIKFSQAMQDHPDTLKELDNLKSCRDYLLDLEYDDNNIIDNLFYN